MNGKWLPMMLVPLLWLGAMDIGSAASKEIRPLKPETGTAPKPAQNAPGFEVSNFRVSSAGSTVTWLVDVRTTAAITRGWLVRSKVRNKDGEVIVAGEDIDLPAGEAGKTYHLTRQFQKDPAAAFIDFQVVNQAENRVVASERYPLPAPAGHDKKGALPAGAAVPRGISESEPRAAGSVPYSLTLRKADSRVQIENTSANRLRLDHIGARAKFQVGAEEAIEIRCDGSELRPDEKIDCRYTNPASSCATLAGIEFSFSLNGNAYTEERKLDAPVIRKIVNEPVIRLEKRKATSARVDMKGSGIAEVTVRGLHVRQGARVTMKALTSADSDTFPVVFTGTQEDDGIHARVEVVGARDNVAPERFCFRLLEITTDDMCGGVGVLLYRNQFDKFDFKHYPAGGPANYFLNNVHCK